MPGEAPNLLLVDAGRDPRDFSAGVPGERLVTDITEFRLGGGGPRAHLSAMVHLYDGRVVAWRCGASPRRRSRRARPRTRSWLGLCERAGVTRSMSRRGHSPNNAAMEGFFGRLKVEMFGGRDWSGWTPDAFAGELAAYICWCNASRIRALREGGRTVWDTTDGRRRRLGTAA